MKYIDYFLDRVTMYRLVLYYLILLLFVAFVFCLFRILPYNPFFLLFTTIFLVGISWATNKVFAWAYQAPANVESVYISALILALIISPMKSVSDLPFLFWAAVLTMVSKYILAINKKHIFNPVAIGVAITAFAINGSASWWIGTLCMLPFSLLGFLIVRKIRRYDLVFYFFTAAFTTIFGFSLLHGSDIIATIKQIVVSCPIFFFAFIMLTEPLTTPPTKSLQSMYGALTGILFAPQFHIGSFYTTPELALVISNVYSYIVSPKHKIIATVQQKLQYAPGMVDFLFASKKKISFSPGQYMEWTLHHKNPDSRGNRRYFTIASSPTEETLRLGVRIHPKGSSYKKAMETLDQQTPIVGAQLGGDFTLPKNPRQKLVFLAGGIGITPFRSMIKFLVDTNQKRDIVLFYSNKSSDEIMYSDVFNQGYQQLGIQTIYTLTDESTIPASWQGKTGRVDAQMISQNVPDYKERTFYISGPQAMVDGFKKTLKQMGISDKKIKTDFFPGFA